MCTNTKECHSRQDDSKWIPTAPPATSATLNVLIALNVLSLIIYAVEWKTTGTVVTTSGERAQGYHEGPATLALVTLAHQIFFSPRNGWHPLLGKIAIGSTIVCLAMATRNFKSGIRIQFVFNEALPLPRGTLRHDWALVWNETVNIHQFFLYAPLLIYQLWQGYQTAKLRSFQRHQAHMQSAMMFVLGPLSQRFAFNHLTDRDDAKGLYFQVVTYSMLMVVLDGSAAKYSLRVTLGMALVAAILFVRNETSALSYLLVVA